MKTKLIVMGVLLLALSFIFKNHISTLVASANEPQEEVAVQQKKKDKKGNKETAFADITIAQQWNLPEVLNEVSGIAYISASRFACVQDEDGIIFIYNTATGKVEQQITFAGAGDYEGLTLDGNTAYVVRSDGVLYEVANYTAAQPKVTTYKTPFSTANNIEGLTIDKANNRLLLAVKDKDLASSNSKGVYAFDLGSKKLSNKPLFAVADDDALLSIGKKAKTARPSAIAIHPRSGQYFIVDGPKSRLLIVDKSGKITAVKELGNAFVQPEGITFDPSGKLFISNERGKKSAANIIEIAKY